jgi:hypothetical protein
MNLQYSCFHQHVRLQNLLSTSSPSSQASTDPVFALPHHGFEQGIGGSAILHRRIVSLRMTDKASLRTEATLRLVQVPADADADNRSRRSSACLVPPGEREWCKVIIPIM